MMPHRRQVVAELKHVLSLLGGQDRPRVGQRGEVSFELADAGEGIVPPDFELAGDQAVVRVDVEADLHLKERALGKHEPLGQRAQRFKAESSLPTFLASL